MTVPEWTIVDFIHRGPWWHNRGIRSLNILLALPLLTSVINGLDSSLVNGLQILPGWQASFNHPDGKTLGLISAAQVIGSLISLPFTPLASDNMGRRPTLFMGSMIMLAGVALQTSSTSIGMFVGARVLVGMGLSFALNAAPLLITELAYPTQRGKLTSMYNSAWYLESPRFLVAKGRESEAARILARFHANGGDERDPLVVFEMAQIRHALKLERHAAQTISWKVLFATPGNRKRMRLVVAIAMFSQWSGNGLVSYYINLVLDGVGISNTRSKAVINGGLQIWNFVAAITSSLLIDRVGRRPLFIASNIGMLIDFAAWTITTALYNQLGLASAAKATLPFIFVFYLCYDMAYSPLLVVYTLEILPFNIRAKGFAVMNIVVSLTLAFNQFVNPWALDALGWKYYLVYCGWLIIELVFVLSFVVETRGRTLEETAALFDGEEQPQDLVQLGGEAATQTMTRANIAKLQLRQRDVLPEEKGPVEFLEMRADISLVSSPY
ncbi:hypothetical protein EUX98_g973 [Antrodiella citrinella]|uniref:Major facilitator superfamily (MFS) profile domain-containing protein n=1 Tax=Antrodiella citrinella TaxID=2447956 RepID=A0A4S4N4X4_9APHY|nr:hypothetical protein EUX98_g973 [Antrodiella citrinella]